MSEQRTVLMIGGPKDGTWCTTTQGCIEVEEMPRLDWKDWTGDTQSVDLPMPVRHQYYVAPMDMFGFRIDVAVCEKQFKSTAERNKAVLRALLQRDVAARMGVL